MPHGGSRWRIYIITHRPPIASMYAGDPEFGSSHYCFLGVSDEPIRAEMPAGCPMIHLPELPYYRGLGAFYAESEAVYNVFKNEQCLAGLDHVGFLHWDKELRTLQGATNITKQVSSFVSARGRGHVSFETHRFLTDYNQHILADATQPDVLVGEGTNCYDYILADYNRHFGTRYALSDLERNEVINLCSCFLLDVETFRKMMGWCADVIETRRLEVFDTRREHRLQGGLLERYYGVFLSLEYDHCLDLTLEHHYSARFG